MKRAITIFTLMSLIIFIGGFAPNASGARKKSSVLKMGDNIRVKSDMEEGFNSDVSHGYFAGFDNDLLVISTKGTIRLDRVVKNDSTIVEYPYVGAEYDAESKSLSGLDKSGEVIIIAISEINYIDVTLLVKEKQIPTRIYSNSIHARLRTVKSYPELIYKIPLNSIKKIDRWKKRSSSVVALGAITGGVLGYLYGYENAKDDPPREWLDFSPKFSRETKIGFDVVLGVVVGSVAGLIVSKDGWKEVSVRKLKVSLIPSCNKGAGLSLAVRF